MTNEIWQKQRSALNHDWLKNRFLVAHLRPFIARLAAGRPDPIRLAEFASQDWITWTSNRNELVQLLDTTDAALSPSQLLDQQPLSASTPETRAWLGALVHVLWLARNSIQQKTVDVKTAFAEADISYEALDPLLRRPDNLDIHRLTQSIPEFREFERAVQRLSDCIHRLPHSIQVV